MRGPWRAGMALALHIGFFVVPIGLLLGLSGIAVRTAGQDTGVGVRVGLVTLVVAAVFGVGLRAILRIRVRPGGVTITKSDQQRLWRTTEEAARELGAPVPDEIRVTASPLARLREDTGLLGWRCRTRSLEIGLPLIAGLNVGEFRAALARELARPIAGGKTRALACRISASVEHASTSLTGGPTKWLFSWYARLCLAITRPLRFAHEFQADVAAVRLTGKRPAVLAARKIVAIELGWQDYCAEYLSMASLVEHTPDLLLGFHSLLEQPERKKELAERSKQHIAEQDTHSWADDSGQDDQHRPTVRHRIDEMKRLSAGEGEADDRHAWALLRTPRESVPDIEDKLMVDGLANRQPWPELARLAGATKAARQAGQLSSAAIQSGVDAHPSVGGFLAAIHRGQGSDLINPVLNPGLNPERVPEAAANTLTKLLGCAVVDALVRTGHAQHELDWAGPSQVRLANGQPLDPDRLIRPAVNDPRLIPGLHRTLVDLGVSLNHAPPVTAEPDPSVTGLVTAVRHAKKGYELLVTDRGLILVPSASNTFRRLLGGVFARLRRAENDHLAELAGTPVEQLRNGADVLWVDTRDVATARLSQWSTGWALRLELYFDEYAVSELGSADVHWVSGGEADDEAGEERAVIELRSTPDSEERADPYGGLGELMGARMTVDDQRPRKK